MKWIFKNKAVKHKTQKEIFQELVYNNIKNDNYKIVEKVVKNDIPGHYYESCHNSVLDSKKEYLKIALHTTGIEINFYTGKSYPSIIHKSSHGWVGLEIDRHDDISESIERLIITKLDKREQKIIEEKQEQELKNIQKQKKDDIKYRELIRNALNIKPLDNDLQKSFDIANEIIGEYENITQSTKKIQKLKDEGFKNSTLMT